MMVCKLVLLYTFLKLKPIYGDSDSRPWKSIWSRAVNKYGESFTANAIVDNKEGAISGVASQADGNDRIFDLKYSLPKEDKKSAVGSKILSTTHLILTDYKAPFAVECPGDQFISRISSFYNDQQEDRRFRFSCSSFEFEGKKTCHESGWLENRDFLYDCGEGKALVGVSSKNNNGLAVSSSPSQTMEPSQSSSPTSKSSLLPSKSLTPSTQPTFSANPSTTPTIKLIVIQSQWTGYKNNYDESFSVHAYDNNKFMAISGIASTHSNQYQDRIFKFRFSVLSEVSKFSASYLSWTDYNNDFTKICSTDQFLTSLNTYHGNNYEDRRFRFGCSRFSEVKRVDCVWSDYANDFDKSFTFECIRNKAIAGISSYYRINHQDRRFKFYCCRMERDAMPSSIPSKSLSPSTSSNPSTSSKPSMQPSIQPTRSLNPTLNPTTTINPSLSPTIKSIVMQSQWTKYKNRFHGSFSIHANDNGSNMAFSGIASTYLNWYKDRIFKFRYSAPLVAAIRYTVSHLSWTDWDSSFTKICSTDHYVTYFNSINSNNHHDRRFQFGCSKFSEVKRTNCVWSNYVNDFDKAFTFECSKNKAIAGISSDHSNNNEDRRFKFYCCVMERDFMPSSSPSQSLSPSTSSKLSISSTIPLKRTTPSPHVIQSQYPTKSSQPSISPSIVSILKRQSYWTGYSQYLSSFTINAQDIRNNMAISGIASTHDNNHEDRIFKFRFSGIAGGSRLGISYLSWTNKRATFTEICPNDHYFTYLNAYHQTESERKANKHCTQHCDRKCTRHCDRQCTRHCDRQCTRHCDRRCYTHRERYCWNSCRWYSYWGWWYRSCSTRCSYRCSTRCYCSWSTRCYCNYSTRCSCNWVDRCSCNWVDKCTISYTHTDYSDRRFRFGCSKFSGVKRTNCAWSDYVNDFDGTYTYECGKNKAIAGISSYYSNNHQDRRFKFYCCLMERDAMPSSSPSHSVSPSLSLSSKPSTSSKPSMKPSIQPTRSLSPSVNPTLNPTAVLEMRRNQWTEYKNRYDGSFSLHANVKGNNTVFCGVSSTHSNHYQDRIFKFRFCVLPESDRLSSSYLSWTEWDSDFTKSCSANQFIVNFDSYHSDSHIDRVFKFGCSKYNEVKSTNCEWSDYVNDFDGMFTFECSKGKAIAGISSNYSNNRQDRRFKFYCCQMERDYMPSSSPSRSLRPSTSSKPSLLPSVQPTRSFSPTDYPSLSPSLSSRLFRSRWTEYKNEYGKAFAVDEEDNDGNKMALSGVSSEHSNNNHDRIFKFRFTAPKEASPVLSSLHLDFTKDSVPFNITCPDDKFVTNIISAHWSWKKDRIFLLGCSSFQDVSRKRCEWSDFVNDFDETFTYECGLDRAIAGMYSYYSNNHGDRRFKFYCCIMDKMIMPSSNPSVTPPSEQPTFFEGRRFNFKCCEMDRMWSQRAYNRTIRESELVKKKISNYFDDVRDINHLCVQFTQNYGVNVCEMECGSRRRNRRGYFEEESDEMIRLPHVMVNTTDKNIRTENKQLTLSMECGRRRDNRRGFEEEFNKRIRLPPLMINTTDKNILPHLMINTTDKNITTENKQATLSEHKLETCNVKPVLQRSLADSLFQKEIQVYMGDPNYDWKDFLKATKALSFFNFCTENLMNFKFDTHIVDINVKNMTWMNATYTILEKAKKDGIVKFNSNQRMRNSENLETNFNMKKYMTMVVLPDEVDFDGYYGFGILHNGLSVIKAGHTKEAISILHEIGHNLGMRHSSSPTNEYGDDMCIMGDPRDDKACFNGAKSFYLGLYRDYTGIVYPLLENCEVSIVIADVKQHLYKKRELAEKFGQYYVIVQVRNDKIGSDLHLIYYGEDNDIVSATVGGLGTIQDIDGDKLVYAEASQRVFDLKTNGTAIFDEIAYKRCPSSDNDFARIMISANTNATLSCP